MRSFDSNPLIILAAGKSSRLGYPKGLVRVGDRFWLEEQVICAAQAGVTRCVIVLGYDAEKYLDAVTGLRECAAIATPWLGVITRVIINPHPEDGQYSSLLTALSYLIEANNLEGAFVLPVDTPCPHGEVFIKLLSSDIVLAAQPSVDGKRGHPVWLAKEFFPRLMSVAITDENARLDRQLHLLPATELCIITVTEQSVVQNLNTPNEWDTFKHESESVREPKKDVG